MSEEVLGTAMKKKNQEICIGPNSGNNKITSALGALGHCPTFDELWVSCGEDYSMIVKLLTTRGNPISEIFLGRDIKLGPSSQDDFDEINGWMCSIVFIICPIHRHHIVSIDWTDFLGQLDSLFIYNF